MNGTQNQSVKGAKRVPSTKPSAPQVKPMPQAQQLSPTPVPSQTIQRDMYSRYGARVFETWQRDPHPHSPTKQDSLGSNSHELKQISLLTWIFYEKGATVKSLDDTISATPHITSELRYLPVFQHGEHCSRGAPAVIRSERGLGLVQRVLLLTQQPW